MTEAIVKDLLEAGVHFGHQTRRWNPKMKRFIFGAKSGIYIVDLEKTAQGLVQAREFLRSVAAQGGPILFVGTKRQAQPIIEEEAARCGQYFVSHRWLGGLLTNFQTIRRSLERLNTIRRWREDGTLQRMTKKEAAHQEKELAKLEKALSGILEMGRLPKAMVVVDAKREETAVKEANRLNIPVVALVDTNTDPDPIAYVIPGNDDAIRSIKLILSFLADGVLEGRQAYVAGLEEAERQSRPAAPVQEEPSASPETPVPAPEAAIQTPLLEDVEAIVPEAALKTKIDAVPPKKKRTIKAKPVTRQQKEPEPPVG